MFVQQNLQTFLRTISRLSTVVALLTRFEIISGFEPLGRVHIARRFKTFLSSKFERFKHVHTIERITESTMWVFNWGSKSYFGGYQVYL